MEHINLNPSIHSDINDKIIYARKIIWNLAAPDLVEEAINNKEGSLADNGSLVVNTGKFTGRSPEDRFIVYDDITKDSVYWGNINKPFEKSKFELLLNKMLKELNDKTIYIRDCMACASDKYKMNVRVINTMAWHNLFVYNMFIRPTLEELEVFDPEFTIICDPTFEADPEVDGTRQKNFAILNMSEKLILIGGTAYSGEMKKGVFSALNFLLPHHEKVLSMHCSANIGKNEDTAIFFGLSGTGKTTLSTDPNRDLIGDDEHGWDEDSVFNFEGGCYAKVINLSAEDEPDIFNAIKFGALVENTKFIKGTREIDYTNSDITLNTRVSYPIDHIDNIRVPSVAPKPKNIFFLTADASGVLPPIARLTTEQAMYHFISGYTSKVAGTEMGIKEPKMVFSACFGEPFMPLPPTEYAELLGKKMEEDKVNVWLINTGWSGGPYGVGSRIKLKYTRAIISAALEGKLDDAEFKNQEVLEFSIPAEVPNVPTEILDPVDTWEDKEEFKKQAHTLINGFKDNFKKYEGIAAESILKGAPGN